MEICKFPNPDKNLKREGSTSLVLKDRYDSNLYDSAILQSLHSSFSFLLKWFLLKKITFTRRKSFHVMLDSAVFLLQNFQGLNSLLDQFQTHRISMENCLARQSLKFVL